MEVGSVLIALMSQLSPLRFPLWASPSSFETVYDSGFVPNRSKAKLGRGAAGETKITAANKAWLSDTNLMLTYQYKLFAMGEMFFKTKFKTVLATCLLGCHQLELSS